MVTWGVQQIGEPLEGNVGKCVMSADRMPEEPCEDQNTTCRTETEPAVDEEKQDEDDFCWGKFNIPNAAHDRFPSRPYGKDDEHEGENDRK